MITEKPNTTLIGWWDVLLTLILQKGQLSVNKGQEGAGTEFIA